MNRDALTAALERAGDAYVAARAALLHGDTFEVYDSLVPVEELRDIYRRREQHTLAEGLPTLGFSDAVDDLNRTAQPALRLGQISGTTPPRHFQLFLTPDAAEVVACLAVGR